MLSVAAANADELVNRADANGDGSVSLSELRAACCADVEFNQRIEQSFADYDTDGDGLISEAERNAKRSEKAEQPAAAETARPATAASLSADSAKSNTGADGSGGDSVDAPPPSEGSLSRFGSLILEIDADNSDGASTEELVASGGGLQWFTDRSFDSADKNGDNDLDPDELEVLLRTLERRRH